MPTTAPVLLKKLEPVDVASLSAAAPEPGTAVVNREPTETVWIEVTCVTAKVLVSLRRQPGWRSSDERDDLAGRVDRLHLLRRRHDGLDGREDSGRVWSVR